MNGVGAHKMIKEIQVRVKKLEDREDILVSFDMSYMPTPAGEVYEPNLWALGCSPSGLFYLCYAGACLVDNAGQGYTSIEAAHQAAFLLFPLWVGQWELPTEVTRTEPLRNPQTLSSPSPEGTLLSSEIPDIPVGQYIIRAI